MKVIDFNNINNIGIQPEECVNWVRNAFRMKYDCNLPSKISTKIDPAIFFNTMPVCIPAFNRFGVKVVSRFPDRVPALQSDILLYDSQNGDSLALMDASWITAMRTGAVAALAIDTLKKKDANVYAFLGLGNTARATLLCLLAILKDQPLHIRLLCYKGQEQLFMERFAAFENLTFSLYEDQNELVDGADVVVSCVTVATELVADDHVFKKGVLVVPVHTRGFQNCDLFFDKVYADDKDHIKDFKYFDKFKTFDELSNVLLGKNPGRQSDDERILAYNIGIALHDIYFASCIYNKISTAMPEVILSSLDAKFWV